MEDHPLHNRKTLDPRQDTAVNSLASRTLTDIANRSSNDDASIASVDWAIEQIHTAAMHPDSSRLIRVKEQALRRGISPVTLSEVCIPAVARILGDQWCEDDLGFAGVTIGCARLTSMLRAVDLAYSADPSPMAPHILVLVGDDVYHTLGATVLSGILRRAGFSTRLWIGACPATLAQHLAQSEFDAVFISASIGENLEAIRRLVSTARTACPTIPVVVGGTIIEYVGCAAEVQTLTGATLATNDPYEALELCQSDSRPGQLPDQNTTNVAQDRGEI